MRMRWLAGARNARIMFVAGMISLGTTASDVRAERDSSKESQGTIALTGDNTKLHVEFTRGFVSIRLVWKSLAQKGYQPTKTISGDNGGAIDGTSLDFDWTKINCYIDQVIANPNALCPNSTTWEVQAIGERGNAPMVRSNKLRIIF
jgi:hypothetical protein